MKRVAGALVGRKALTRVPLGHEIDLVDDDARGERVGLGDDEKPVEHARVRLGPRRGENDDHLIDVRGDDAFAIRTARRPARQARASRQNLADRPRAATSVRFDEHLVAHSQLQPVARPLSRRSFA